MRNAGVALAFLIYWLTMALLFVMALSIGSCKSQAIPEKVEKTIQTDSVVRTSHSIVKVPVLSELVINEVCDSVTSKPVAFTKTVVVSGDTLTLWTENNDLRFKLSQAEQQLSKIDSMLNKENSEKLEQETIVVKQKQWGLIKVLAGIILAFTLFPALPKIINQVCRKFIGI